MKVDCHYCEYATCSDPNSWCNCNVEDFAYFDHKVKDSKKEAEECDWFEFCQGGTGMMIDYTLAKECKNEEVWYTCYQCGKCGRVFDNGFMVDDGGTTIREEQE